MNSSIEVSMTSDSKRHEPIAIVGMSCIFPGSIDTTGFWRNIVEGRDLISDVPPGHWLIEDYYDPDPSAPDKTYAKRGAFLPEVDFDPMAWGVPPTIVPATDTCQLLSLIVARQVLDDATRGQFAQLDRERVSVILGVTSAQELLGSMVSRLQRPVWTKALREAGLSEDQVQDACARIASHYTPWQESTFPGVLGNVVAGRIANRLDLHGTNCVTDAACASTFSALSMAVSELRLGDSDLAICGGADTMNDIFMYMCFSKTPALSMSGDCRPFSDKADGTMLGEGIGMIALKRLADARQDGDQVYAVLRGIGSSSDGRAKSVYAPLPEGQARAVRRAYDQAGYSTDTVEFIEAHGTGTKAGDAAEFEGLRLAFGETKGEPWCALGSIKSQVGHTKSAAGAAGLMKAVMALTHRTLAPTIKIDQPNPKLALDNSPFYLSTEARPWVSATPRRAGVSSFGFGGSNFHLAVEEAPADLRAGRRRTQAAELVALSAANAEGLVEQCRSLRDAIEPGTLAAIAFDSVNSFTPAEARVAIVAASEDELRTKLDKAIEFIGAKKPASSPGLHIGFGKPEGRVAFMFPGQGSQYLHMGAELAMQHDACLNVWDRLSKGLDRSERLDEVVFPRPVFSDEARAAQEAKLRATQWAQPAIGAVSASQLALLETLGLNPDMVAGHSFGELTALFAAGALDEAGFLEAARQRGHAMNQAADKPGSMLAASATLEAVRSAIGDTDVVIANHNHHTQVVLSGATAAIDVAESKLDASDISSVRLSVATAFHSPIVSSAVGPFSESLETIPLKSPRFPVYANATAQPYGREVAETRRNLASALAKPVRFVEQVEQMYRDGARTFVEVGPGSVLTGLVGRILRDQSHRAVSLDRKGQSGAKQLIEAMATLVADGHSLNLKALWAGYQPPVDPRQSEKPKMVIKLNGANYGKPYPPKNGAAGRPQPNPPKPPPAPEIRVVEKIVEKRVEVPAPVAPSLPPVAAPAATQWLSAFEEAQRQTAAAHEAFQQSMAESHAAYLKASEASMFGLAQLSGSTQPLAAPVAPTQSFAPTQPVAPAPAMMAPPAIIEPAPITRPVTQPARSPAPVKPVAPAAPSALVTGAPASEAAVTPPAVPAPVQVDVAAILLQVVSDKTGYPAEMVGLEMDLEADLGVDSIKRVEILSAMKEQVPGLPDVEASELAKLRTLAEIAAVYEPLLQRGGATPTTPDAATLSAVVAAPVTPAAPSVDLKAVLLSVVSEKTGYPAEMVGLDMDLEADLGVDSIKRVEILSAMKEQVPGLPDVEASELAKLRTLAEIAAVYEPLLPKQGAVASSSNTAGAQPTAAAPGGSATTGSVDLHAVLLSVVSEKTGYPSEMVGLDMDLEADLGVDSIKRVEILSAMKEQIPGLPEVEASELAKLRTLAEIAAIYAPLLKPSATLSAGRSPAAAPAPSAEVNLHQVLVETVAEKTGYPAEMVGLDMDLEADLGVDSIKRVEILSAMRERVPGLPEVEASELAKLRTLNEIAKLYEPLLGGASPSAATSTAAATPTMTANSDLEAKRFVLRLEAAPARGFAIPGLATAKHAVITDDGTGIAAALQQRLALRGIRAELVANVPANADAVIFLGGLRPITDIDTACTVQRNAFAAAKNVAPVMAEHGGVFVTVQDTGGSFALENAEKLGARCWIGGLAGLVKTAAQEWPQAALRAIDLERGSRDAEGIAAAIDAELFVGGHELEVAISARGERRTLRSEAATVTAQSSRLGPEDIVVATGGARGVTAKCLVLLAASARCRFVLLGRTPLAPEAPELADAADEASLQRLLLAAAKAAGEKLTPPELKRRAQRVLATREVRGTISAIEAAGGQARYETVDAANLDAVAAKLHEVRESWGPITALVHGAGVIADRFIADKSLDDFDRVFNTKTRGLQALLQATSNDQLKVISAFSSVAGRTGNRGQSDYAMANEVLNKVLNAERARRAARGQNPVVKSFGWGPWEGGMVTPALKARFEALGVPLIGLQQGAKMFVDELASMDTNVELVFGGEPKAEALLAEDGFKPRPYEVVVDRAGHPFIEAHRVQGRAVVPVVMALEWFARAAAAHRPDLVLTDIRDARVLSGIRLDGWDDGAPAVFHVSVEEITNGGSATLAFKLEGDGGRVHYTAKGSMAPRDAHRERGILDASPPAGLGPLEGIVYDGRVLFHGTEFQVIRGIEGVGAGGVEATLLGARGMGWPGTEDSWQTDPAMLDGGLQLAVLWTKHQLGGAALPTAVGELTVHQPGLPYGSAHVVLHGREADGDRAVCDVVFMDSAGAPIAELRGVVTHVLPGSRVAGHA